jgi:hypothetical protein
MPSRVGCTARATLELIIIAYLALGNRCPERSLAGLLRAYPILTLYLPCIYPILALLYGGQPTMSRSHVALWPRGEQPMDML